MSREAGEGVFTFFSRERRHVALLIHRTAPNTFDLTLFPPHYYLYKFVRLHTDLHPLLLFSPVHLSLSLSLRQIPVTSNMGRSPCCDKNGLKKGPWTPEEDQKLIDYIQKNGYGNWRTLPKNAGTSATNDWVAFLFRFEYFFMGLDLMGVLPLGLQRCGKSCRLRWTNYLRPDIKRGRFSFEEEETIIQLHSILGNKWVLFSSLIIYKIYRTSGPKNNLDFLYSLFCFDFPLI